MVFLLFSMYVIEHIVHVQMGIWLHLIGFQHSLGHFGQIRRIVEEEPAFE